MTRKEVHCFEDVFRWPDDYFNQLTDKIHEDEHGVPRFGRPDGPVLAKSTMRELFVKNVQSRTFSLSYAGVDTPGSALLMMLTAARDAGHVVAKPRFLRAIEYDDACQMELMVHPSRIESIFGDLNDFWVKPVKHTITALKSASKVITLDALLPLIHSRDAVDLQGFDVRTKTLKPLVPCDIEIAGVDCRPYSPFGQHGGTSSDEITATAAWAAIQLKLRPKVIIVEESSLFDVAILQKMFMGAYRWEATILNGVDFGLPVNRRRFYAVGHCVELINRAVVSFTNIVKVCFRDTHVDFSYHDLAIANSEIVPGMKEEIYDELVWSCNRKKSKCYIHTRDWAETMDEPQPHLASLTESEAQIWQDYLDMMTSAYKFHKFGITAMLNQKPKNGRVVWTNGNKEMYTVIANPSLHMVSKLGRWLTPKELLLMQGIPIHKCLTNPGGSQVNASSFGIDIPGRSRRYMAHQAGNAMQVPVVGAVLLHVICFHMW
jgi:site-specific DNA-cytosine methylase